MIAQYRKIKNEHPDHLLFYRMGDFYELFFDDAIKGADLLNITLTKRGSANGAPIPMAGIPHHSASGYFQRLVDQNITFAICEQVGVVQKNSKDPVAREVTQIVTPGTVLDEDFMQDAKSHALMSLYLIGNCIAVAILNLSKSTIEYTECETIDDVLRLITLYDPSEILISEKQIQSFKAIPNITIRPDWDYYQQANHKLICDYFNISNLNAFSCDGKPNIISAIGSILNYLAFTKQGKTNQVKNIAEIIQKDIIKLDQATLKHMVYGSNKNDPAALFTFLNHTKTPMGDRLLRTWCGRPTSSLHELFQRQKVIKHFVESPQTQFVKQLLKGFHDLERCAARIQKRTIKSSELIKLSSSLKRLPELKVYVTEARALDYLPLTTMDDLATVIEQTIYNPLSETHDSQTKQYIINHGVDESLDRYRSLSAHGDFLTMFEKQEQERLNNNKVKVGFNRLQGYYIEISKSQNVVIPDNYIRRQTLKSAERYVTEELEAFEKTILTNQAKAKALEATIFETFIESLTDAIDALKHISESIAKLDALLSLSHCAQNNWVLPTFNETSQLIDIEGGFHPMVAASLEQGFIANDTHLTNDRCLSIITGPNMGGKSTYMRQTALITILGYMGSMVPAKRCELGKIDQIFTRVGAHDDIIKGQSTFMVEMQETAFILRNATANSLVIMDEIGRGTSTFDGLSIAYACASQIANKIKCLCLFATHYFELTQLESLYPSVTNWHVAAKEDQNELIFLHKVLKGAANKSYGIAVAQLAGIPADTILMAKEKLHKLELNKNELNTPQLSVNFIIAQIQKMDVNNLSPKEAWDYLSKLQELVNETII